MRERRGHAGRPTAAGWGTGRAPCGVRLGAWRVVYLPVIAVLEGVRLGAWAKLPAHVLLGLLGQVVAEAKLMGRICAKPPSLLSSSSPSLASPRIRLRPRCFSSSPRRGVQSSSGIPCLLFLSFLAMVAKITAWELTASYSREIELSTLNLRRLVSVMSRVWLVCVLAICLGGESAAVLDIPFSTRDAASHVCCLGFPKGH